MRQLDLVVVIVYLVAIAVIGLRLAGRQKSSKDYFVGDGKMPWWTVCFSVVATETSVLTVISVPGGAYTNQGFGNVELALGYVIGRVVVATVLIPLYRRGGFVSAWLRSPSCSPGCSRRVSACSPRPSRSSCCSTSSA